MKIQLILLLFINFLFADVYATYEVQAKKQASLNVSSVGIVKNINIDIGDNVKKGDVLLSLNDLEEKANLEISKNNYNFLLMQYERYKKSADVFDKNSLDKLESELNNAKNTFLLDEAKLDKMRIVAPFDGIISEKNIEIGDMSSNNQQALIKLVSKEKKLLLSFDSKYESDVKVGDLFCKDSNISNKNNCVKIYKIYPTLNSEKKLNAEAYGLNLKIGNFGDGLIIKGK